MTIEAFDIQENVSIELTPASAQNLVSLYTYTPFVKSGYRLFSEWVEIKNIRVISWIYNTPRVPFPVFELEDSESKQLLTAIELEWDSPRIELEMSITSDNGSNWRAIRKFSLLNNNPYPFREYEAGDYSLGSDGGLAFKIQDVGFGILRSFGSFVDKVTITADLIRHVRIEKIVSAVTRIAHIITNSANLIVPVNNDRQGISFFNTSNRDIFIDTRINVSTSSYMIKLVPGAYYEPVNQTYTGAYYAIHSQNNQQITIEIRETT
jgi:hypothetical protein